MSMFYVLISLCLSGSTLAQVVTTGGCPNVQVQQNFNIFRLAGRWFEQARFHTSYEVGTECGTFDYMGLPNNAGKLVSIGRSILTGIERVYETAVLTPDLHEPAKLLVKIPLSPVEGYNNLWVLGTDYENWGVFFSCSVLGDTNVQYAWIVTRVPVPDDSVLASANALLLKNKIDTSLLEKLDDCNRLWVLDSGKVGGEMVCIPKLLAFDLSTDKLVQRVYISPKLAMNTDGEGLLVNLVVDTVGTDCAETNVYMADMLGSGLVVWNGNDMWRIESPYFEPDPKATEFSVDGTDFQFSRGLFALSLTKEEKAADRLLYFRPLSSYDMYHTQVTDLHSKKDNQSSIEYSKEPTKLRSQSVAQAFTSTGILFFSGTTELSVLCWNRHKPFTPENIATVAQNETTLQWASGMKIYPGFPSETLWILSDRWQDFYTEKMNFNETNFRILIGSVDDLVRGTNCE